MSAQKIIQFFYTEGIDKVDTVCIIRESGGNETTKLTADSFNRRALPRLFGRGEKSMYTIEQANVVLARCREKHPEWMNIRIEKRRNGSFRVVFDHFVSVGRKASDKRWPVSRTLIAQWRAQVSPELWAAIERPMTAAEAEQLRSELEPQLPPRWRIGEKWHEAGFCWVIMAGKQTLVTSHCEA